MAFGAVGVRALAVGVEGRKHFAAVRAFFDGPAGTVEGAATTVAVFTRTFASVRHAGWQEGEAAGAIFSDWGSGMLE